MPTISCFRMMRSLNRTKNKIAPVATPLLRWVNQLFQNLYETAESSIWMRLGAEKEKLAERFKGQENAEACTGAVLALLQEQLEEKARCRQQDKGCSFFVRLSKPVLEALASDEVRKDAAFYGDKVGGYLKALLEEYCALPYAERERIYYRQQLQSIELAITRQEKLKLTLSSRKKLTGGRGLRRTISPI